MFYNIKIFQKKIRKSFVFKKLFVPLQCQHMT